MSGADVIVVGGGIVGCSTALALARAGVHTMLLERTEPGAEASSAAAGILGPAIEAGESLELASLGRRSLELHAELAARLREDLGVDVGFRRCGAMHVALGSDDSAALDARAAHLARSGMRFERIGGTEARRREPALSPEIVDAIDLPDEAQIDPPVLVRSIAAAAQRAGAIVRSGVTVQSIVATGSRVSGVVADGDTSSARWVVVAAGSWSGLLGGVDLPHGTVFPIRGQIAMTRISPPILRRIVVGERGYLVARPDGRTLAGSTEERAGFRREVTLGGVASILASTTKLVPALATAPLVDAWSGLRPQTTDDTPLVGPWGPEGLLLACGHFRNGMLLGPVTAELILDHVAGRPSPGEASVLDPRRLAADHA